MNASNKEANISKLFIYTAPIEDTQTAQETNTTCESNSTKFTIFYSDLNVSTITTTIPVIINKVYCGSKYTSNNNLKISSVV